ncbi:SLATT domain-containing protein [Kitasatospora sp. NPDC048239]|uniref:SLATT domain-containing protein n=1 Tax=Kitasatospora sp. NPDC048239 TaxID=3364046 RepID=UPI003719AAD0
MAKFMASTTSTTEMLIQYRREVEDLKQRIKNRRLQVAGLYGTAILLVATFCSWVLISNLFWLNSHTPGAVHLTFFIISALLAGGTALQVAAEFHDVYAIWPDRGTSVRKLKLDLELAEERRVLEARSATPETLNRQASYKERLPGEVARLRKESRHYRRVHLLTQWLVFASSASITAVTAWYDPPQPGKGVLIALGFIVTVVTGATGYFKPRERAFNLQQTADSIEQHSTALDLGIAPYAHDEATNLASFAATVEGLRADQRMREQQLDQPFQGQQEVI